MAFRPLIRQVGTIDMDSCNWRSWQFTAAYLPFDHRRCRSRHAIPTSFNSPCRVTTWRTSCENGTFASADWPDRSLQSARKPIYDDRALIRQTPKSNPSPNDNAPSNSPPYTDRLAKQIGRIRKAFYDNVALPLENGVNTTMSAYLNQEQAFTQTIASLAPPPETHERVMPGALYIFVAAMAGSIVSRNRNILLRASVPFAVGIGTAWVVLPNTTRNVADLIWQFEERAPIVAENHMRIRGAAEEGWRQAEIHGRATKRWSDERIKDGREMIESWVRKGKWRGVRSHKSFRLLSSYYRFLAMVEYNRSGSAPT